MCCTEKDVGPVTKKAPSNLASSAATDELGRHAKICKKAEDSDVDIKPHKGTRFKLEYKTLGM